MTIIDIEKSNQRLILNEELLSYATKMGCKTEMDFTLFLRVRESILSL